MKLRNSEKSIVIVTHDTASTGGPMLAKKLAESFRQRGYYVAMVSLRKRKEITGYSDCCDAMYYADKVFDFIGKAFKYTGRSTKKRQDRAVSRVVKKLYRRGFRQVITNTVVSGDTVAIWKRYGFRVISLIHEMRGACTLFESEQTIREMGEYADVIVFPSELAKKDFLSFTPEMKAQSVIRPQGYYHDFFPETAYEEARVRLLKQLHLPEKSEFLVGAGTISFLKGNDLLPLIAKATEDMSNLHFLWMGSPTDAAYSAHLQAMTERLGVADRIHYIGFVGDETEYANVLRGCKAFLLTSREDTYPSTMLEAAAARLPIVAFDDCGGAHDFLADGCGYLVPYMDTKQYSDVIRGIVQGVIATDEVTKKCFLKLKEHFQFDSYTDLLIALLNNQQEGRI